MANYTWHQDFEDMEMLDKEEDFAVDFHVEANERVFRVQKDRPLDVLHVQENSKDDFEPQMWLWNIK